MKRTRLAEKAWAKEIGGKGEHGKKRRMGTKEAVQDVRWDEEEERVRMAPNMAAGGSHSQAMTDVEEDEKPEEERGEREAGGRRREQVPGGRT